MQSVRAEIARAAALIPPGDAPNAWRVKPERLHLTLEFLGELDGPRIEAALRAGDAVKAASFILRLDTIGHFTGANVAWIGPLRCPPSLAALKAALDRELLHQALPVSTTAFVPHVTSVRGIREAPDAPVPAIDWPVREFVLIRNSSASGRSRYTVLRRWPLGSETA
jgi:2'-5' RNA ligase